MTPPIMPIDPNEDRRLSGRQTCEKLELMEDRLLRGDQRMDRIEKSIVDHRADTAEVLEILKKGKIVIGFGDRIGKLILWVAAVSAALATIWAMLKGK